MSRPPGALLVLTLATTAAARPDTGGAPAALERLAAVKQWTAEVLVTSDCDRGAFDGSHTAIHNRLVTTYQFTRRVSDAPFPTWRGRGTTTYRWSVTTGVRDSREVEESEGTFEIDSELQLTTSTRIVTLGRPPARPFTKTRYIGETPVDTVTANDWPPSAELFDAPLPSESGTLIGRRTESAYSLFGGAVINCPAERHWMLHP